MDNPFESPSAVPRSSGPGSLDVSLAFEDGMGALQRNAGPWVLANIVGGLLLVISLVLCFVPALVVGPAVFWATTRITLDAVDGEAQFDTIMRGFDRLGEIVPPMLVFGFVMFLLNLPPAVLNQGLAFVAPSDATSQLAVSLVGMGLNVGWAALLTSRFQLGLFAIVDENRSGIDALSRSWELTEGHWGQAALIAVGVQILVFVGFAACCVGVLFTTLIGAGAQASAWRQLTGTRRRA